MDCWLKWRRPSCHSSCWSWSTAVKAHQRGGVGEDAHHLGAAVELGVDTLDGVGQGDRLPVVHWEGEVGEHIGLGGAQLGGHAREVRFQHSERMSHSIRRGLRRWLQEDRLHHGEQRGGVPLGHRAGDVAQEVHLYSAARWRP